MLLFFSLALVAALVGMEAGRWRWLPMEELTDEQIDSWFEGTRRW